MPSRTSFLPAKTKRAQLFTPRSVVSLKHLKYPKKSHRKLARTPRFSKKLAEFFGLMLGDGGINNDFQVSISLNSERDQQYSEYIVKICKELFGVVPVVRKRKTRKTLVISLASITVVDFLVSNGLPRGNKLKNGLRIPKWILQNAEYKKACVRGLVDTDGCVFIHKHFVNHRKYTNLTLTFTSYDKVFLKQIADIFKEFGIMPRITKRGKDIYLYKNELINQYFSIFGSSNSRLKNVYNQWRRSG